MKTLLVFSLILMSCCPCRTQKKDILLQAPYVDSGEDTAETEGGEEEQIFQSDIWAELRKLRDMLVEQKVELRHLVARVTAAESLVEALQTENRVRKLAFSASLLASGEGNTGSKEFVPLIYRNVFTNIGNHYNSNTGYLTAPVRGVYYFRFTGHLTENYAGTRMRIVKNGHAMVFAGNRPITSTDAEDSISNGVVLQLEVGDVVAVQISGDVWDDQYHRTTFSGFLLFPL
uniref:C1q domain-containing protein n=1 Tax=Seriola lalandi dorsalis TaxID=1841481 RepID=A0A3B4XD15_SERLL